MKSILLLLDQAENQSLLAAELSTAHHVIEAASDEDFEQEFDLAVVDGPALDRLWEKVRERKIREQPVFLPFLLVTSRPSVKMITRHLWRSIDELIISPIEKPELRARVEILLRARSLSLEMKQRADEAEQASKSRDEVLAMVSHDLRNPLNLVLTSGSFLLETATSLSPREREQVRMIHRAAEQMNRLIQDLLEVSGIEAGNIPIDLKPEAVAPLVREACSLMTHAAEAHQITLTCEFEQGLPDVQADRDRILQVLGNLVANGIKFTPEGGRVTIGARRGASTVVFFVQDSGSGISESDLPHIFDRFWQSRRAREGGAGLGLAIARGIISAHGGEIRVESREGKGSTFLFALPAAT